MCLQSRSKHADVSMFYSTRQRLFESAKAQSLDQNLFPLLCFLHNVRLLPTPR